MLINNQQQNNILGLQALNYIRAVARILIEEIEKGFPVSDEALDKIVPFQEAAFNLAHEPELKDFFYKKEL